MLQGWQHKVVTILLYHDCIALVGTTTSLTISISLFQTCCQLGANSANTTCWQTYYMWVFTRLIRERLSNFVTFTWYALVQWNARKYELWHLISNKYSSFIKFIISIQKCKQSCHVRGLCSTSELGLTWDLVMCDECLSSRWCSGHSWWFSAN